MYSPLLFIFILPWVYGQGSDVGSDQQSQTEQDLQYQAKLDYCYGLYADISDDFGWFFQAQKKTQYNQNCGDYGLFLQFFNGDTTMKTAITIAIASSSGR